MEFSRLSSPSLKELFVQEIEGLILSGQLSPGDKLPPERELATRMSVSRGVVNAGMLELARKGFVEILPRAGVVVSDYNRTGTIETLMDILKYNGGTMPRKEMKSLLEIRLVIENLAIRLAVQEITAEDLETLYKLYESFREGDTPRVLAERIFSFHHELCILSGNTILPIVFFSFRELAVSFWERYFILYGKEELVKNTAELYGCIKERDTEKAVKTFESSLFKTIEGDVSIYPEKE